MPHSKQMPSIGPHCHELRIVDVAAHWRIIKTPKNVIHASQERLRRYDDA
jgi:hypothetical protein